MSIQVDIKKESKPFSVKKKSNTWRRIARNFKVSLRKKFSLFVMNLI